MVGEPIECGRCGMSFEVGAPRSGGQTTRCAESGCGRRFWHVGHGRGGKDRVGIWPSDPLTEAAYGRDENFP